MKRAKLFNMLATPKALPREVVVSTEAACRFMDFIYSQNIGNDCPRMAVTKCVCQTAADYAHRLVRQEPDIWCDAKIISTRTS